MTSRVDMRGGRRPVGRVRVRRVALLITSLLALTFATGKTYASSCLVDTPGAPSCGASPDPGSLPRTNAAPRYVGNPIDVVGGNKHQREDDFRALGSSLAFSRRYNSALVDHDLGLGPGWRHSYQVYLTRLDADTLRIAQSDGRRIEFGPADTEGRYRSTSGHDGRVEPTRGGHRWVRPDGWVVTFQGSWPVRFELEGVASETLTLRYERRRLASVTDAYGRTLRLRYTPGRVGLPGYDEASDIRVPGHLESLLLPGGQEIELRYDNLGNFVLARYPDGTATTHAHEDGVWPHHLTRRRDASGERTWAYDEAGRAVAYRNDATGEALDVRRETSPDGASGRSIVTRDGGATSVHRWTADGADDGHVGANDVRVVEIAERRCDDCEVFVRRPAVPTDDPPARARNRETGDAVDVRAGSAFVPASDDPYSLSRRDALGRKITVRTDFRGDVLDVVRDGVSYHRRLSEAHMGFDGTEGCGDVTGCLVELAELMDIANAATRPATSVRSRSRSGGFRNKGSGAASRFCTLPNGRTCAELERDWDLGLLAKCVYEDEICVSLYETVTAKELGLDPRLLERKGFAARISRHTRTGEYVVAFRGTDDLMYDLIEDVRQFAGEATSQYRQAQRLAEELESLLPKATITYTGHSLGGGLATIAALTTHDDAVVFNAAALHSGTASELGVDLKDADGLVSNLAVDGEIVTTMQDREHYPPGYHPPEHDRHLDRPAKVAHPAPGRRYTLPRPRDAWLAAQKDRSAVFLKPESFRLHLMETVMKSIDTLKEVACGT